MAAKLRDAARSREAILAAAERLFSESGYRAVSMQAIGEAAGLSRGAPAYFFGTKDALYATVLRRVYDAREDAVRVAFGPLATWASHPVPARDPQHRLADAVAAGVDGYLRFLEERPSFARLVSWEALEGGRRLAASAAHTGAIADAFAAVRSVAAKRGLRRFDPDLVSAALVSLCFLPVAHSSTFATGGIDTRERAFRRRYRAQVVDAVLHLIGAT